MGFYLRPTILMQSSSHFMFSLIIAGFNCSGGTWSSIALNIRIWSSLTSTQVQQQQQKIAYIPTFNDYHYHFLKVQCVRFMIIVCEKWNIIYLTMFIVVENYHHVVIIVFMFAKDKPFVRTAGLISLGPPCFHWNPLLTNKILCVSSFSFLFFMFNSDI